LSFDNVPNEDVKVDPAMCLVGMFLANKPIKMKERMVTIATTKGGYE